MKFAAVKSAIRPLQGNSAAGDFTGDKNRVNEIENYPVHPVLMIFSVFAL
jgi:hypothetical protein